MSRKQEVCRDFQRGNCRFGARCKYLHTLQSQQQRAPQQQQQQQRGFGTSAAFNQPQQQRTSFFFPQQQQQQQTGGGLFAQQQQQQQQATPVKEHKCIDVRLCKEQIREDFTNERPSFWRLTSYAHWKYQPNDVNGDASFEELRGYGYEGARQGMSIHQVAQREAALVAAKTQEFENLLKNYRGPAPPSLGSGTPFLGSSPSASPFFAPVSGNSPGPFGTPSPAAVQQPFQHPVPSPSPFKSSPGIGQGFVSPFAAVSSPGTNLNNNNFQGSNLFGVPSSSPFGVPSSTPFGVPSSSPFGVPSTGSGSPWPSFFPNPPSSVSPAGNPVHKPLASPFTSPFPPATTNSPLSSPFHAVPPSTAGQVLSASMFRGGTGPFPSPAPANFLNTTQSGQNTAASSADAKWLVSKWSIGEIPEEEPPLHVR